MKVVKVLIRNAGPAAALESEERKAKKTPIMRAAQEGDANMVKQIINVCKEYEEEHKPDTLADINCRCSDSGFTAFHYACANGR